MSDGHARWTRVHLDRAARVGKPFEGRLVLPTGFAVERTEGLAVVDLHFDTASTSVIGTPTEAGEFEILLHGSMGGHAATLVCTLPVTPDPASLWKDVPSDPNGEHARADNYATEVRATDGSRWVAASRRGRRHAHQGAYRDDAVHVVTDTPGGWHVAAVADGAGSAEFSRAGAAEATRTAAEALAESLGSVGGEDRTALSEEQAFEVMTGAVSDAVTRLDALATTEARDIRLYATTLLLVATRPVESGWQVVTYSIGDGAIAIFDADRRALTPMSVADGGEFAGETRFLGRDVLNDAAGARRRLFVATVPSMTAVMAMTDGITDAKFDTDQAQAEVGGWVALWNEFGEAATAADDGQALLGALDFLVQAEHDDRTLAVFLPPPSVEPEA